MTLIKVKSRGTDNVSGRRNLIINGAMQVAQRGDKTGITSGSQNFAVDRFKMQLNDLGTWAMTQSTTVPSGEGFTNSLKLNCTAADTSVAAGSYFLLQQVIEAKSLQHLGWGTSSAKNLTWSFWIRSTKTGVVSIEFQHQNSSGNYYTRSSTFTISASNTWEKKIITVPSNTAQDIENAPSDGLYLSFWFTAGTNWTGGTFKDNVYSTGAAANTRVSSSVPNHADSTNNEIYLTGVQCEVADSASDFEHRSFAEEQAACQRYFYRVGETGGVGHASGNNYATGAYYTASDYRAFIDFPVTMRANPTITSSTVTNAFRIIRANGSDYPDSIADAGGSALHGKHLYTNDDLGSATAGDAGVLIAGGTSASFLNFDAEI